MSVGAWTWRAALAALCLLAAAAPAKAAWRKAETHHFVVYSEGSEAALREYAVKLEVFDQLLRKRHRLPPDDMSVRKLPVFLVAKRGELKRVIPEAAPSLAGFYTANPDDTFAVGVRDGGDDVMLHEYAHHFMLKHFPAAHPAWLVEGYAEYFMTADIGREQVTVGEFTTVRTQWLTSAPWMKLEDLLKSSPGQTRSPMYYPQAWLLTHYFISDPGRAQQLGAYTRAVAGGGDPVRSMEAATGASLSELDKALRRYVRGRIVYGRMPRSDFFEPEVKITTLPASADDLLLERQQLMLRGTAESRADLLERIRQRAPRHRGDRLAELTLARAETRIGDRAAGEAVLARWLAVHPEDVEALRLLAESRMDAADGEKDLLKRAALYAEARRHVLKAMKIDQSDYQTLLAYARSRTALPDYPTANDITALMTAHSVAPQVASIRMNAAAALLHRGDRAAATRLLQPVLNHPHDTGGALRAKQLLAGGGAGGGAPAAR